MKKNDTQQRILIVDDSPEGIHILRQALKSDYTLVAATNGERALRLACSAPAPDLILLDIMMPGLDGFEVCRELKSNPVTREIPVIFVTALGDDDDQAKGLAVGGIDYITKPYNPLLVRARVKNHMELRRVTRFKQSVTEIIHHDLKSPLNAVIGLPEIILEFGNLNPEQEELLAYIRDAGYRMLAMINSSLDLYKMESGTYKLRPKPIDLIKIVRMVESELMKIITVKGLGLEIELYGQAAGPQDDYLVMAEDLPCYCMLENLIKNALEASPKGGRVRVELGGDDSLARIVIRNQGPVPRGIRDRFFEKFITEGKPRGTGIGTYSARLIARAHLGDITFRVIEEEFTELTIALPRAHGSGALQGR